MSSSVNYSDILAARDRLEPHAVKTPLIRFPALDERVGATVLVKLESLQRTGSFKFRGAFNCISQIPESDRAKGVVACSSGNHAQGVAEAARILGMQATIVMPEDAPAIKTQRTRNYGAAVVTYDRATEDRDAIARDLCERTGATFVHPYSNPHVIAGQGTTGLEIAEQAMVMGIRPDAVLVGASGGGLASGIALALEHDLPEAAVYTVEPEGFDDYAKSLALGHPVANETRSGSVCDALMAAQPGELPFEILKRRGAQGLTVSDQEALSAMAFAFFDLKLVVEPGGVVALAALLSGKVSVSKGVFVLVLTGGNVDPGVFAKVIT